MDNELINNDEVSPNPTKQKRKPYVLKIKRKEKYEYKLDEEQKARQKECIRLRNQRIKDALEYIKNNKIDIYSPVIDNQIKTEPSISVQNSVQTPVQNPVPVPKEFDVSVFKTEIQEQLKFIKTNNNNVYYAQIINLLQSNRSNFK